MNDELPEAFDLAACKSKRVQAAIAARIKEMIEADAKWEATLADPDSLPILEEMAEEAHQEYDKLLGRSRKGR